MNAVPTGVCSPTTGQKNDAHPVRQGARHIFQTSSDAPDSQPERPHPADRTGLFKSPRVGTEDRRLVGDGPLPPGSIQK
jgi:hypothetical protein